MGLLRQAAVAALLAAGGLLLAEQGILVVHVKDLRGVLFRSGTFNPDSVAAYARQESLIC